MADRLAEQNIELILADSARDLIARQGYDPVYGARPLKRVIQREIGDKASMLILGGEVTEGGTIAVRAAGPDEGLIVTPGV